MKELYSIVGISKQALHKHKRREEHIQRVTNMVVHECNKIRTSHKRMSCRRMFVRVKSPLRIGRDIFEQIGFANGFKLQIVLSKQKTTWATKLTVFDNHLEGKTINGMNQALQSDIFYFNVQGKDYYGVSIIDIYSRRLLALHVSKTLKAEQNILALKSAIAERKGESLEGCIFHSDRGSQYISKIQIDLLKTLKMIPSMCKLPQENAYAERVQGSIKQEYLDHENLSEKNLHRKIKRIKWLYNYERPHTSLGNKTPVEFEEYTNRLPVDKRKQLTVYKWTHPLLTESPLMNKKEKRSKKEKSQHQIN